MMFHLSTSRYKREPQFGKAKRSALNQLNNIGVDIRQLELTRYLARL